MVIGMHPLLALSDMGTSVLAIAFVATVASVRIGLWCRSLWRRARGVR
jgi:hypothetical protein